MAKIKTDLFAAKDSPMPSTLDDIAKKVIGEAHKTIAGITEDIDRFRFNRCVAALYTLSNAIGELKDNNEAQNWARRFGLETLARLIAPIAPHIAEEMWENMGHDQMVALLDWPKADEAWLVTETINMPVQVNGKLRGTIDVAPDCDKALAEELALALPAVQKILDGNTPKKVIVVPNRIVNVVAKSLTVAFLSIILLAGCSSTSVVNTAVYDEISKIGISIDKGRTEQLYRQELQRMINRNGLQDQQYELRSEISSDIGDNNVVMSVKFELYDQSVGEVILSHGFSSSASIGAVSSTFASSQAEDHAQERLSLILAQKTFGHLMLFFSNRNGE